MADERKKLADFLGEYPSDTKLRVELRQWQDDVYSALDAAGHAEHPTVKFGGTVPLHLLPADQQIDFMGRYRRLIGLNTVLKRMSQFGPNKFSTVLEGQYGIKGDLNNQIMNVWSNLSGEKSLTTGSPFGRFQGTEANTLIGRIYGAMNLQMYDRPTRGVKTGISAPGSAVRNFFGMGAIQKLENLDKPLNVDLKNKNLMIFDIETAGFRPGSIREVAYRSFQTSDSGTLDYTRLTGDTQAPIVFRPVQGTRGTVMGRTGAVNLDEFIQEKFGLTADVSTSGDDFINKMMPFLKKAKDADYIVGHNIEQFDFAQIFEGIAKTSRYRKDKVFRAEMDNLYGAISGKTVDTLRLARQAPNLASLETSALTVGEDIFSIQNLLLETDLAKRIGIQNVATAMGYDAKTGLFTKGLHHGDVDMLVTAGLYEHLPHLGVTGIMKSGLTEDEGKVAQKIVEVIQNSAAITPFTDIRDKDLIDANVRRLLKPDEKINPIEQEILQQRRLGLGETQKSVQEAIKDVDPRRLAESVGGFDRLIGRGYNMPYSAAYDQLVKPDKVAFEAYQQNLAKLGYGFAGLSYEERLFGTALSDITLRRSGEASRMARETLIAKFQGFEPTKIQYITKSQKVTLPTQVLAEAGIYSKPGDPALYNLSTVRPTALKPEASINLAYRFTDEQEVGKVTSVLERMRQSEVEFAKIMGLEYGEDSRPAFARFIKAFEEGKLVEGLKSVNTQKYGVSVGQITDRDAVNEIITLESAANNSEKLRDATRLQYRLAHAGFDKKTGETTTAGLFLDKGLQKGDKQHIARSVAQAGTLFDPSAETGFGAIRRNPRLAASAAFYDRTRIVSEAMPKIFDFFGEKVIPQTPKIAIGAAVAGVGAFLYSRKRRNDRYDIDFNEDFGDPGQGRYAVADLLQARIDAGYDGGRVQVDPLATASLTQHLYYGSIGQHKMDWDRNTAIYGGVL